MKRFLLILVFATSQVALAQPSQSLISLPSKQYLMSGVENRIYIQTFMKNAYLGGDVVRFEGDAKYDKGGVRERYAALSTPTTGEVIDVKLYDGETFEVKDQKSTTIYSATPAVGKGEVLVQLLGDSFTKGCYFKDALLVKGYVPNIKLIGTRSVPEYEHQRHEGRGGWTLQRYFSNNPQEPTFYNPFFQPTGDKRFWGSVEFWKIATSLNRTGGKGEPFSIRYNCGDYDTSRFGEDGVLLSPKRGDMMYSADRGGYIEWSGKAWRGCDKPAEWDFDYGKYLDMWEFEAPQYLVVMLGLNDFRDKSLPFDFDSWNAMIERVLVSYRKAVPSGSLLLSTPCTSCGVLDNESGAFTTRQNAMMWYVRQNIIDAFDCREAEGVYVVDASATIDNENGYNTSGDMQIGNPHPYPNYPQLGVPIAAFIQYNREK